jgi:predicted transcriptional regulator of viral defense system
MNGKPDYNRLYEYAEEQAGYFTAAQAHQAGFSWERLTNSIKSGKFLRADSGVYRLAQFPRHPHEDLFFTWLSVGPNSVISHDSALAFYDLSDALPTEIHVIVPRTASRRRKNIRLHTQRLVHDDVTIRDGLRVTTVARTIADVAASGLAEELVRQAIQEALRRGLVSHKELLMQSERRGGRAKKIITDVLLHEVDQ